MAKQTKGFCKYCGNEYTKSGMLRHLPACKKRKARLEAEKGKCGCYQVSICGKYDKDYWLIIEISENAALRELDQFIRNIWVECCGHLSAFKAGEVRYEAYPAEDSFWGAQAKSMKYKLKDIFTVGETVSYEYDYGSTTELVLSIHSYGVGEGNKEKITILSRNNPLEILCSHCGENKAQWINPEGYYEGNAFWCEECLCKYNLEEDDMEEDEEQEFDDYDVPEYFLPVCNSPRMGVCGYEGSKIYPDQFEPDEK